MKAANPNALHRAGLPALATALLLAGADRASAADLSEADCIIEPNLSVDLSTSVDGIVDEILVDRGDVVAAGDVLVRLESGVERVAVEQARLRTEQMAEIEIAEQNLAFARRQQERSEQLLLDNAISRFGKEEVDLEVDTAVLELQRAVENRERALLDLRRAEEVLRLRSIPSPIDGVVVEVVVARGEAIGEQQTVLLKLVQIDPLNVELIVPAREFGSVEVGMLLTVRPAFPVDRDVTATVTVVDPIIDASSATFGVRARLPNPDFAIPAGLTCQALSVEAVAE